MITPIETIDFGIAVKLEDVVSEFGLWPNIRDFLPGPIDETQFKSEIETIKNSGVTPCQVYHPGDNRSKDEVKDSRLDIRRNFYEQGTIGFGNTICLDQTVVDEANPANNRWSKKRYQQQSLSIEYEIRYICRNEDNHRTIDEIIATAFGVRTNVQCYNKSRELVEGNFEFYLDGTPTEIKGADYIERMYRFQARDVFITRPETIREDIVPIQCVEMDIALVKNDVDFESINASEFISWDLEII